MRLRITVRVCANISSDGSFCNAATALSIFSFPCSPSSVFLFFSSLICRSPSKRKKVFKASPFTHSVMCRICGGALNTRYSFFWAEISFFDFFICLSYHTKKNDVNTALASADGSNANMHFLCPLAVDPDRFCRKICRSISSGMIDVLFKLAICRIHLSKSG